MFMDEVGGWGVVRRSPRGGRMDIFNENYLFLHTSYFQLLCKVRGRSLNSDFFKFIISVRGGHCDY